MDWLFNTQITILIPIYAARDIMLLPLIRQISYNGLNFSQICLVISGMLCVVLYVNWYEINNKKYY